MMNRRRHVVDGRDTMLAWMVALLGLYWFAASFFLAKRSLSHVSDCHQAAHLLQTSLGLTQSQIQQLQTSGILTSNTNTQRQGCWMNRQVDSLVILLVDALRFDFALYDLPQSVGRRLQSSNETTTTTSRLYQFVADPPTVTMQRLKALTTGGLPTFADISANFGGATVEDDSWIQQLVLMRNYQSRGLEYPSKIGFVGDDTWVDMYGEYLAESHPYPSFNTRDLDTVDNGCLHHIPQLLSRIRTSSTSNNDELEVLIVHFLGVDHVGHTYGPHNQHMDTKLRQMDQALTGVLERLDLYHDSCHATLIFGDHGMTEDGNHGGGTEEEVNAALFVHTSPGCRHGNAMQQHSSLEQDRYSDLVQAAFSSIHQIDLVPTIALLLGLPIPYANLGSLTPSLLLLPDMAHTATALALNAAQVWRYFNVYSKTANRLPHLDALEQKLQVATSTFQEALAAEQDDADLYQQAAALYKIFLMEALELGQRVWTRFDNVGMIVGVVVLSVGLVLYTVPLWGNIGSVRRLPLSQYWEVGMALLFMLFVCGMLSFSNSYILEEEHVITYCLTILSILVALRIQSDPVQHTSWQRLLLLPVACRFGELFVSGHGLDPSIRLHMVHHSIMFLGSLAIAGSFRWYLYRRRVTASLQHAIADCATLLCLAASWCEKRSLDPDRNGFLLCRLALLFLAVGIPLSIAQAFLRPDESETTSKKLSESRIESDMITILAKVLIAIVAVTGPSAATTLVLYTFQVSEIFTLSRTSGSLQVPSLVVAVMWKLVTRHVFFATNHGCAFNRLQYSAAFIATKEFYFVTGGISLFLNTFGWEMVGIAFAWLFSQQPGRSSVWRIYGILQLIEALTSCISVSLLRRHLMVWDIYAPHFLFASIFTVLNGLSQITASLLSIS